MSNETDQARECMSAIISYAFKFPKEFDKACMLVPIEAFTEPAMKRIFLVLLELSQAGNLVSLPLVVTELRKRGALDDLGGVSEIARLATTEYLESQSEFYIAELIRLFRVFSIRVAAQRLIDRSRTSDASPDAILGEFSAATDDVSYGTCEMSSVGEAAKEALERAREARKTGTALGIPTGYHEIDSEVGGFHRGQLILLSGRTYSGKTTLALNFARKFALKNRKVFFCCLEMKDFELAERLLCMEATVDLRGWSHCNFTAQEFGDLEAGVKKMESWPVQFSKSVSENPMSLRGKAKLAKSRMSGLDLIVVDHLQCLAPANYRAERHRQLVETARAMKHLARELDCPLVLLSQLKTDSEEEPTDSDYSESKAILQEADQAYMLHRKKTDPFGKLIINKNRKGCSSSLFLDFDGPFQTFKSRYVVGHSEFSAESVQASTGFYQ